MVTTKIARLEKLRASILQLEKEVAQSMKAELLALPRKYGFTSPAALYQAMEDVSDVEKILEATPEPAPVVVKRIKLKRKKKGATGNRLTALQHRKIKRLIKAGELSDKKIAKAVGCSSGIIYYMRKKMKAGPAKAAPAASAIH